MNPGVTFYKKLKITSFNKRNGTIIRSVYANLKAKYGKNVRIDEGTYISEDVTIGDQSYVNANSRLQHCDVGKYCSISSNVNINPYNHNMRGLTTHPIGDVDREIKRVVIGNDVLISLNVTILEGVHIGDGAVIGAGAVVSHNVGGVEYRQNSYTTVCRTKSNVKRWLRRNGGTQMMRYATDTSTDFAVAWMELMSCRGGWF